MPTFINKPTVIYAEQLVEGKGLPQGVQRNEQTGAMHVTTIQGQDVPVNWGEWIIRESDGLHYYPCADDVFRAKYRHVDEDRKPKGF